jgi:hypothetical protein
VTGGAGALTYGVLDVIKLFCPNTKGSKVCDGDYHYVKIEIDNNKLTFTAQATKTQLLGSSDGNFKVLDSFSYEKPFPDGKDPCLVVNPEPDPVPEPIPEPAVEPVPEPGPDPVHEPAPEPVPEPVPEPAPDVPDPGSPAEDPGAPPVDPGQPDVQPQPEVAVADGEADAGAVETSIATAGKSGGCGGCSAAAGNGFGWLVALLVAFARLAVRFIFRRRDSVPGNSETSR